MLSNDETEVVSTLDKLLKTENYFVNDDIKFWCHKELSELYGSSERKDEIEQFRHIVAALQIKFDESMLSTFKKIKSQYFNNPRDRLQPSKIYIKYCYAALDLKESTTIDEIEDAVIGLQINNHPDDEQGKIKHKRKDHDNKKCDNLFTDLELSKMRIALTMKN